MTTETLQEPQNGTVEITAAPQANLVGGFDPKSTIERSREIADALGELILRRNLYSEIQGKKYVHLDGWQMAGTMLGVVAVVTGTEQIEGGWKATAEARTLDGRVIGAADSVCIRGESKQWNANALDYALVGMAQTRAMSRALRGPLGFILKLSGYESTTAEDATAIPVDAEAEKPSGDRIDPDYAADLHSVYRKSSHKADALKVKMMALGASDTSSVQAALETLPASAYDAALAWIEGA